MKTIQLLFISFCLLLIGNLSAQNPKVDSLLNALDSNTAADQAEILWGIAYELFDVDNAQALFYGRRAYELALRQGDSLQIVKVGTTFGQLLRRMDNLDESIQVSSFLLLVSKRNEFRKYTKILLNSLALTYTFRSKFDTALVYHSESLVMRVEDGDDKGVSGTLQNIGIVYYKIGDYDLSLDYCVRSLRIMESIGYTTGIEYLYSDIGSCHVEKMNYEIAIKYFDLALDNALRVSNKLGILIAESGKGNALLHLRNFTTAEILVKRSYKLAKEEQSQRYQIFNLLLLAKIALAYDKFNESDAYLSEAESLPAMKEYDKLLMDIYLQRADLYFQSEEFKKASLYYSKYIVLKEIVFGDEMNKRLRQTQTELVQRDNIDKIRAQSEMLALQQVAISRQVWVIVLSSLSAILAGCLTIFLFRANKRKNRINSILEQRIKERTFTLEQQRDQFEHAFNVQSIALKWISRELQASFATWRGLSYTAAIDLPHNLALYFRAAEATAEKTARAVQHLLVNA